MQPRLIRSKTDVMLAGVCGGLGEYFTIDPVIVRLIFVLVTLTSGIGLPVYFLLWLLMPKASSVQSNVPPAKPPAIGNEAPQAQFSQESVQWSRESGEVIMAQQRRQARTAAPGSFGAQAPGYGADRFDPLTGQPLDPSAATGQTVNLRLEAPELPAQSMPPLPPPPPAPRRARNWRSLGVILVGIGGLVLLEQLGVNMAFVFPALLIVAGVILLTRRP